MEDTIYRTSTQYRLWSFTQDALASLRSTTNCLATSRVKDAMRRVPLDTDDRGGSLSGERSGQEVDRNQNQNQNQNQSQVDCLTVEEEQKLVNFYCVKAMDFADFCDFPTNVKATAVQYLKRFYLSNSPMTYHPKQMMPSALFLTTKTENHYTSLKTFVAKLPKTTAEDVIAPEFLLTQGLRFTFDVRHPHRGLEGGFMELLALAMGTYSCTPESGTTAKDLQRKMLQLEPATKGRSKAKDSEDLKVRIQNAHGKAKEILKTSALLTDAYFLYTPSQIWLSSLLLADEVLSLFYLSIKFPVSESIESKLLPVLQSCATLMKASVSVQPGEAEMKELMRIDKKLYKCRNPEKMDLVGINKTQKRDGERKGEGEVDEKIIKKRKMERENGLKEAQLVFGPPLEDER